jgi:hypothetical protein
MGAESAKSRYGRAVWLILTMMALLAGLLVWQCARVEPDAQPGIWILSVETGATQEVITPGHMPPWLP